MWLIRYGVNQSHICETVRSDLSHGMFTRKKDAIKAFDALNINEYRDLGYNYFDIVKLNFDNNKISHCENLEIVRKVVF